MYAVCDLEKKHLRRFTNCGGYLTCRSQPCQSLLWNMKKLYNSINAYSQKNTKINNENG